MQTPLLENKLQTPLLGNKMTSPNYNLLSNQQIQQQKLLKKHKQKTK